jgi:hypothetical protein
MVVAGSRQIVLVVTSLAVSPVSPIMTVAITQTVERVFQRPLFWLSFVSEMGEVASIAVIARSGFR